MHKGYLAGAIVLLVLSIGCIVGTVVEVIVGKYGMGSLQFWGGVVFHAATAVIAMALLVRAHPKPETPQEEDAS